MTPQEKKAAIITAKIIRTARKQRGWTQIDTAKKIGVSQSALSKLESGILIPSVHQWFEFCQSAEIPADSHVHGYLDRLEVIRFQSKLDDQEFKVNPIYRIDAASSARSLSPLIQSLYDSLGDIKAKKLIKEMGVDPDYFVDLGNQINYRFFTDLFYWMKKKGVYKKSDLSQVTLLAATPQSHGALYSNNPTGASIESLLKLSFSKAPFYEANFDYKIESVQSKKVAFSVTAKEHLLKNKELQFEESREFIHDYRSGYFKNLIQYLNSKQVQIKDVKCVSNQKERAVYEMSHA